jgi:hypothetical protein
MKKAALALVLVVAAFAATSTFAQAHFNLRADVPFDFTVDGRQYNAGSYELRTINPDGLVLRNMKTGQSALIPVSSRSDANPWIEAVTPQLSFVASGNSGYLTAITDAEGHNWKVPVDKRGAQASHKPEAKKVMVALK